MTEPVDRVALVLESWPGEPVAYQSSSGTVEIESVEAGEQDGIPYVAVTVIEPGGGDPHFRVYNPPALVPDPQGEVERNGQRYRLDPVAALAEVVGMAGGAKPRKGRVL